MTIVRPVTGKEYLETHPNLEQDFPILLFFNSDHLALYFDVYTCLDLYNNVLLKDTRQIRVFHSPGGVARFSFPEISILQRA